MKPSSRTATRLIAAGIVVIAAYLSYGKLYAGPRDELKSKLAGFESRDRSYEKILSKQLEVRQGLKAIAATTLGKSDDVVEHRFRSLLEQIAVEAGLEKVVVNNSAPSLVGSPTTPARVFEFKSREMRRQPDFAVVRGTVQGEGTLDQVLHAMAAVRVQPWIHRVSGFTLKPVDKEKTRFAISIDVTTLHLRDLASDDQEPQRVWLDAEAGLAWASVVEKNVFRIPPPDQVVAAIDPPTAVQRVDVAPLAPPYGDWKMTGLIEASRSGVLAIMVNIRDGRELLLSPGGMVIDAKFIEGAGERAVFEIDGKMFEVFNGRTLAQRQPVSG